MHKTEENREEAAVEIGEERYCEPTQLWLDTGEGVGRSEMYGRRCHLLQSCLMRTICR